MTKLCAKNSYLNKFLNFVQRIFCSFKIHAHHAHKKIIHHVYKRRFHWLNYIHIILLLLLFYLYNITTFNQGQEVTVPTEEAPIVIQNEPQIVPTEMPQEVLMVT